MRHPLLAALHILMLAAPAQAALAWGYADSAVVRAAVVLPLSGEHPAQNSNMLDFCCGAMLAADQAGAEGIGVDLTIKDFNSDTTVSTDLDACRFIVGPARPEDLLEMTSLYPGKTIISPLDQRAEHLAASDSVFVQFPPHSSVQFRELVKWAEEIRDMSADEISPNFILLSSDADPGAEREAASALKDASIPYQRCKCGVQGEIEGWEEAYNPMIQNYVIIAISSEAALNNAVRNIGIEVARENVIAFTGGKIRSYHSIPVENIHRAGIHAVCSYYVDYDDNATAGFISRYRNRFDTFPSQFAFQGYDLMLYMLRTFARYPGDSWQNMVALDYREDLLQTSVKLSPIPGGGLVNEGVRRVEYLRDYSTILHKR